MCPHRTRTARTLLATFAATLLVAATGCLPDPDTNGDGVIDDTEQAADQALRDAAAAVHRDRVAVQQDPFLTCVRRHESDRAGAWPYTGGYSVRNYGGGSAAGAYQFINSTWRNVSVKAGHPGYPSAADAPWWAQDAVAKWMIDNGHRSAWAGTRC